MSTCLKDLTVDPENLGQLQTLFLERGTTDRSGFKMSKEFEMNKALLIHLREKNPYHGTCRSHSPKDSCSQVTSQSRWFSSLFPEFLYSSFSQCHVDLGVSLLQYQQTRELLSSQKTSCKHNNDLTHLQ